MQRVKIVLSKFKIMVIYLYVIILSSLSTTVYALPFTSVTELTQHAGVNKYSRLTFFLFMTYFFTLRFMAFFHRQLLFCMRGLVMQSSHFP